MSDWAVLFCAGALLSFCMGSVLCSTWDALRHRESAVIVGIDFFAFLAALIVVGRVCGFW